MNQQTVQPDSLVQTTDGLWKMCDPFPGSSADFYEQIQEKNAEISKLKSKISELESLLKDWEAGAEENFSDLP